MIIKNYKCKYDIIIKSAANLWVSSVATLLPSQLKQVAKHATIGLARTGSISHSSSGDIFLAFSTQIPQSNTSGAIQTWQSVSQDFTDPIYEAAVQAIEEAIINALVAAKAITGINGNILYGIPHNRLIQVMKKYNR